MTGVSDCTPLPAFAMSLAAPSTARLAPVPLRAPVHAAALRGDVRGCSLVTLGVLGVLWHGRPKKLRRHASFGPTPMAEEQKQDFITELGCVLFGIAGPKRMENNQH